MAEDDPYTMQPVGFVRSELVERTEAPMQGAEGAPDAWIDIEPQLADGLRGIEAGQELLLITWMHLARRDVLLLHPRSDPSRPLSGVFTTRSPDRPNPLGLHRVAVREVDGASLKVGPLEAIDGTPVVDIKPVLTSSEER